MMLQNLIVALIVAACTGYAAWVLMPSAWRRALAQRLQNGPWPERVASRLRRAAQAPTGCACDGCDANKAKPAGTGTNSGVKVIRIHRQPRP
jgi:hypothetical protein